MGCYRNCKDIWFKYEYVYGDACDLLAERNRDCRCRVSQSATSSRDKATPVEQSSYTVSYNRHRRGYTRHRGWQVHQQGNIQSRYATRCGCCNKQARLCHALPGEKIQECGASQCEHAKGWRRNDNQPRGLRNTKPQTWWDWYKLVSTSYD